MAPSSVTTAVGNRVRFTLRPTAALRRALHRRRSIVVVVRATAVDRVGNRTSALRRVRIRR